MIVEPGTTGTPSLIPGMVFLSNEGGFRDGSVSFSKLPKADFKNEGFGWCLDGGRPDARDANSPRAAPVRTDSREGPMMARWEGMASRGPLAGRGWPDPKRPKIVLKTSLQSGPGDLSFHR